MNADRRAGDAPGGVRAGRRWSDDPDLAGVYTAIQVVLSRDLHARRERLGWSIDQAAKAAGVAPDTVLALEKARGDPHLSTVARLCYAYGLQLAVACCPARRRPRRPAGAG